MTRKLIKLGIISAILTFMSNFSFAQPAIRICDKEGDCMDISASGEFQITTTNTDSGVTAGDPQIRLCDKEGHCLDITSSGALQIE